jgi:hypothetical protein
MTPHDARRTIRSVEKTATETARAMRPVVAGFARAVVLCIAVWLGAFDSARADTQVFEGTNAPVVRINIRAGDLTVRTWDRQAVAIDADPSVTIDRRKTQQSGQGVPLAMPVLGRADLAGAPSLPAESFVSAPMAPGSHDVVIVKSTGANRTPVVVTVPNDAAFVFARVGNGKLDVDDYRGGTLIAIARNGPMLLSGVGGTVFAQSWHGPIVARGSTFERVRARALGGNVTFEHCTAQQIEATTYSGTIVYDGGSFAPGLARFESIRGNVAIGASGNVQYGAHTTGEGRVYTNFESRAAVDTRNGQTSAVVGSGGPVVTATTQGGNVFLYDGSLRSRGSLPPEWQPALETLQRPAATRPLALPRQQQRFVPPPAFRRFRNFR